MLHVQAVTSSNLWGVADTDHVKLSVYRVFVVKLDAKHAVAVANLGSSL